MYTRIRRPKTNTGQVRTKYRSAIVTAGIPWYDGVAGGHFIYREQRFYILAVNDRDNRQTSESTRRTILGGGVFNESGNGGPPLFAVFIIFLLLRRMLLSYYYRKYLLMCYDIK